MTGVLPGSQLKKQRKHRPLEGVETASPKKKEKLHKATVQSVSPTLQDAASSLQTPKSKSKDLKGKSRALDLPSEFRVISANLVLSIPPVFASDLRAGVEEMLDSMVMRYIPSLQGVLLAHSNIQSQSQTASIHGDCPFAVCNVSFDATIWGPRVSMKLAGRINVCSPDHVSLLVHRTFNVSIPRHHIPQGQWLFEYGPAENDPEFGDGSAWGAESRVDRGGDVEMKDSTELKMSGETQEAESSGRWVHHLTGAKLGDPDGYIEFTVIGLTVANEMLSLQGSIQSDPFSPKHIPRSEKEPSPSTVRQEETPEVQARDEERDEEDNDEEDDGFKHLARLTDAAQATQKAKRAKEEAERLEKTKKRKRPENRGDDDESPHRRKGEKKKRSKVTTS